MLSSMLLGEGFVPLLCWSVVCWMLGVGYAAYRAVGWVDRMRAWAYSVDTQESCSFSGAPLAGAARLDLEEPPS